MNKHTPTPWAHNGARIHGCKNEYPTIAVVAKAAEDGVEVDDAAHIVRCVNSHEALVKALKDLTQAVANLDSPEGGLGGLGYLNESAERAEAVLAAAGEQP